MPCNTATVDSNPLSVCVVSIFTTRMVLSAQERFAIDTMATAGMGNKKITEAVFSSSTDMADHIVPLKTRHLTRHSTTPWHATQTQTAPLFPKWAPPPDPQMGHGSRKPKMGPWGSELF